MLSELSANGLVGNNRGDWPDRVFGCEKLADLCHFFAAKTGPKRLLQIPALTGRLTRLLTGCGALPTAGEHPAFTYNWRGGRNSADRNLPGV